MSRLARAPASPDQHVWEIATGWPRACLIADAEIDNRVNAMLAWRSSSGLLIPRNPPWILPMRPVWSGMLVNSAVYCAAWLVIALLPGLRGGMNRWYWRWRQLCPFCRYDLRESPQRVCPECGRHWRERRPLVTVAGLGLVAAALVLLSAGEVVAYVAIKRSRILSDAYVPAFDGDVAEVARALAAGLDVNSRMSGYLMRGQWGADPTLLAVAAAGGHADVVRLLIEKGADIEAQTWDGLTPLHAAANFGSVDAARVLIDAGAQLEEQPGQMQSALATAVMYGHADMVALLLERGADPNGGSEFKPFFQVRCCGDRRIIEQLIRAGANVDAKGFSGLTALMSLAGGGQLEAVNALLQAGASVDARSQRGETALFRAASAGAADVVRRLIEAGADVNARTTDERGWTPLVAAAMSGNAETVQVLLDAGADPAATDASGRGIIDIDPTQFETAAIVSAAIQRRTADQAAESSSATMPPDVPPPPSP